MKKIISLIILLSVLTGLCACGAPTEGTTGNNTGKPEETSVSVSTASEETAAPVSMASGDFKKDQMKFSIDMFRQTLAADGVKGKNMMVSPLSAETALAMLANGAASETLTELENALCGSSNLNKFNDDLKSHLSSLGDQLSYADSIWIKNDGCISVNQEFIDKNRTYYNAGIYSEPFDNTTAQKINSWVDYNTHGMINKLIDEINESAVMYIINAIAFEAEWETQYEDTDINPGKFTDYNGVQHDVEYMNSKELKYVEIDGGKGFIKPYKDGKYNFVAILPEGDVYDFVNGLDAEKIADALNGASDVEVSVAIPEFKSSYETELNKPLQEMGIQRIFGAADLSGISDSPLSVDKVIHKTYIEVNRKGTKAAAITGITVKNGAMMDAKFVYLDKPFVYMITDSTTNLPVFIGILAEFE